MLSLLEEQKNEIGKYMTTRKPNKTPRGEYGKNGIGGSGNYLDQRERFSLFVVMMIGLVEQVDDGCRHRSCCGEEERGKREEGRGEERRYVREGKVGNLRLLIEGRSGSLVKSRLTRPRLIPMQVQVHHLLLLFPPQVRSFLVFASIHGSLPWESCAVSSDGAG